MIVAPTRLGQITEPQVQAALDRFDLGMLHAAYPTREGLGGQTLLIETGTGRYILRGRPLFPSQLEKESFFTRLLHERISLQVPWPYFLDPTEDIFGWPYALMPYLTGRHVDFGNNSELSSEEQQGAAAAMADALATLHTVTWPFSGEYDPATDTIQRFSVSWNEWIRVRLYERAQGVLSRGGPLTDRDLDWIVEVVGEADDAVTGKFAPAFLMHDFTHYNLVFDRASTGWRVVGVFDLSEAFTGDSEADLARPVRVLNGRSPRLADAFLRRYMFLHGVRPEFPQRFAVYQLDDILVGWIFFRAAGWDPGVGFRGWTEPQLTRLRQMAERTCTAW